LVTILAALVLPLGHRRQRPRLDRAVERLGADDLALGNGERARMEEKRLRLRAAEAAVRADELLERGHLTRLGVEAAVAEDVRDVAESVRPSQVRRRVLTVAGKRILPLDHVTVEPVDPPRAEPDG